jgi:hypothetical protein
MRERERREQQKSYHQLIFTALVQYFNTVKNVYLHPSMHFEDTVNLPPCEVSR